MSLVEALRKARTSRASILQEFMSSYDSSADRVHAFVEGPDDILFYRYHMTRFLAKETRLYIYDCKGKAKVYEAYQAIVGKFPFCRRVVFFVDKDIDDITGVARAGDPRVFITTVYSIENYLVCRDAFRSFVRDHVRVRRVNIEEDTLLGEFEKGLNAFHRRMMGVMAWIVLAKRHGFELVLKDLSMGSLLYMNEGQIISKPKRVSYLRKMTGYTAKNHGWQPLRRAIIELGKLDAKTYVRGKFEMWWFIEFLKATVTALDIAAREAGGTVSMTTPLTPSNFISLLTQSAPAPAELDIFLQFHLVGLDGDTIGNGAHAPRSRLTQWITGTLFRGRDEDVVD